MPATNIEQTISELQQSAASRIAAASAAEELEAVRVEVLGRKGVLSSVRKT